MPELRLAGCLVCLLLLAGCATLDEDECRRGDWSAIGLRDGQQGQPASRIDDHTKACLRYGIEPDRERWRLARERGLQQYCTPLSGLEVGVAGRNYQGVCPEAKEGAFLSAWRVGHEEAMARTRVNDLQNRAASLRASIARLAPGKERDQAQAELYRLEGWFSEISRARDALFQAENHTLRYREKLLAEMSVGSAPHSNP